jgi:hypothetical protein
LPHLQVPITCPSPEPDQSNPFPSPLLEIYLNIIIQSMLGPYKWSLSLRVSPPKNLYALLLFSICSTCLAHLILLDLIIRIILGEGYRSLSSSSSIFSTPLLPRSSKAQIFSSVPYSKHPQPTFVPQCE